MRRPSRPFQAQDRRFPPGISSQSSPVRPGVSTCSGHGGHAFRWSREPAPRGIPEKTALWQRSGIAFVFRSDQIPSFHLLSEFSGPEARAARERLPLRVIFIAREARTAAPRSPQNQGPAEGGTPHTGSIAPRKAKHEVSDDVALNL